MADLGHEDRFLPLGPNGCCRLRKRSVSVDDHRLAPGLLSRVLSLHRGDLIDHRLEGGDRGVLVGGQGALGAEMGEEDEEGVLDPAELLAVARDIAQDLLLDCGVGGLPQFDVDQPDLAADRVEEPGPRVDRLGDVAGQWQPKSWHGFIPPSRAARKERRAGGAQRNPPFLPSPPRRVPRRFTRPTRLCAPLHSDAKIAIIICNNFPIINFFRCLETHVSDTQSEDPQPKPRGRPWRKGESGNPAGRKPGCRNRATRAAEMYLDGEAEALTRLAVKQAFAGDPAALKLCLARTVAPRRKRRWRSSCRRSA